MSLEVLQYTSEYEAEWDTVCANSNNATILHTRKFLGYHADRFHDESVVITHAGRVVGVFPAARVPTISSVVSSHPGATYGGIVHQGYLNGNRMIETIRLLREYFRQRRYSKLIYKPLPHIYAHSPSQDDVYALMQQGAKLVRCDLSCAIDLFARGKPSERRRRGLKKALKSVVIETGNQYLAELWDILVENLSRKHSAEPVHSLDEIQWLFDQFGENIHLRCALIDGSVEAGIILFSSANVCHAQYICSSKKGYSVSGLDAVFESAIEDAAHSGVRYFDFGTSNEENGKTLNDGLYRFKAEFGGGGVTHEYFEVTL